MRLDPHDACNEGDEEDGSGPRAYELLGGGRRHRHVVVDDCLLQSSTIVYYRVADPESGAPLGCRMTSREKKGEGGGQGQEG